eukprot:3232004-Rhodomonas_salina.2
MLVQDILERGRRQVPPVGVEHEAVRDLAAPPCQQRTAHSARVGSQRRPISSKAFQRYDLETRPGRTSLHQYPTLSSRCTDRVKQYHVSSTPVRCLITPCARSLPEISWREHRSQVLLQYPGSSVRASSVPGIT